MGSSVRSLDYSGWTNDQLASRDAARARQATWKANQPIREAREAEIAAHPFTDALAQLSDRSRAVSEGERYRFTLRDLGHGHKECSIALYKPDLEGSVERALSKRGEGDREVNMERARRRAAATVRHRCKAMGVGSLWTLTYRENVQDRELVLKHFDLFRRKVAKLLGGWHYVSILEPQERGAWHIHMATLPLPARFVIGGHKVKSWDLMRRIWRGIVGDLGGNFDEAKQSVRYGPNKGKSKSFKNGAQIASYIAGYMAKDFGDAELNRKRYSASTGTVIPAPMRLTFDADSCELRDLIQRAYDSVGQNITARWFDAARGIFYIESCDKEFVIFGPS